MSKGLELYQSRVSHFAQEEGRIAIHFPHAYIHHSKGASGQESWSQEVVLQLEAASFITPPANLPNMIDDGYLEVDGIRYEVIPLPLGEHQRARLHLIFSDGSELDVQGRFPLIKLIGRAIKLEDY